MAQRRTVQPIPAILGLALVALTLALYAVRPPVLDLLDEWLFDRYQVLNPRPFTEDGIVRIVDIDEASIRELGQWPWPRSYLAELIDRLSGAGAAVIAMDMVFSEPDRTSPRRIRDAWARFDRRFRNANGGAAGSPEIAGIDDLPDHDRMLAEALARSPSVLGTFLSGGTGNAQPTVKAGVSFHGSPVQDQLIAFDQAILNLAELSEAAAGIGSVSLPPSEGDVVRRVPMLSYTGKRVVPALSMEALRVAQGAGSYLLRASDASGEADFSGTPQVVGMRVGDVALPLEADGSLRVYYAGPQPARWISAKDVLDGVALSPALADEVYGRVIFLGTSAEGLYDLVATPLAPTTPGVEVHAEIVEQAVDQRFLTRADWAYGAELAAAAGLGLAVCVLLYLNFATFGLLFMLLAIAGTGFLSWVAFRDHALLVSPIAPAMAVFGAHVAGTVVNYFTTEQRRKVILSQFEHFVSPSVIEDILTDPDRHMSPYGDQRDLSVLFLDVRRFSTMTEKMPPEQVIAFVNQLMTPLTDVILENEGTVDKFIGDAIMAFWNAPRRTEHKERLAVQTTLALLEKLDEVNPKFLAQGWPEVKIGIGINTGRCSVGNMGSMQRLSYTCVGDPVNLASRLEGLTKSYHVDVLIGSRTAGAAAEFALLPVDRVLVKGRSQPELIWTVAGGPDVAASPEFQQALTAMDRAHRARDREDAAAVRAALETLSRIGPIGRLNPERLAHALHRQWLAEDGTARAASSPAAAIAPTNS